MVYLLGKWFHQVTICPVQCLDCPHIHTCPQSYRSSASIPRRLKSWPFLDVKSISNRNLIYLTILSEEQIQLLFKIQVEKITLTHNKPFWCYKENQHMNKIYVSCHTSLALKLIEAEWRRICVVKLFIIGSDNGLSPGWRQAIIWTNAGILLIGPLGTNFSEILIGIHIFSIKEMQLKMSGKCRPFCLGLNVLN